LSRLRNQAYTLGQVLRELRSGIEMREAFTPVNKLFIEVDFSHLENLRYFACALRWFF